MPRSRDPRQDRPNVKGGEGSSSPLKLVEFEGGAAGRRNGRDATRFGSFQFARVDSGIEASHESAAKFQTPDQSVRAIRTTAYLVDEAR